MKKLLIGLFLPISLLGIGTQSMRHSLRPISALLKTPAAQRNFGEVSSAVQILGICAGASVSIGLVTILSRGGLVTRQKLENKTEELQRKLTYDQENNEMRLLEKIEALQVQHDALAEQVQQALTQAESAASDTSWLAQALRVARDEKTAVQFMHDSRTPETGR